MAWSAGVVAPTARAVTSATRRVARHRAHDVSAARQSWRAPRSGISESRPARQTTDESIFLSIPNSRMTPSRGRYSWSSVAGVRAGATGYMCVYVCVYVYYTVFLPVSCADFYLLSSVFVVVYYACTCVCLSSLLYVPSLFCLIY